MTVKHGTKGYITHFDGSREDVIFWFEHSCGLVVFYTKNAKYIYYIEDDLCVIADTKPFYQFETSIPEFDADIEDLLFNAHDKPKVIEFRVIDLWESEE